MEEQQPQAQGASGSDDKPSLAKPRNKAYAPTPRQLEALQKARASKKAKREQQANPSSSVSTQEVADVMQDLEVTNEPKPVVRDNRMVREFVEEQRLDIQPTNLGRRKRPRVDDQVVPVSSSAMSQATKNWPVGWIAGAGVVSATAVAAALWTLQYRTSISSKSYGGGQATQSPPASSASSATEAGNAARVVDRAPWE